ncbi:MAG: family 1 glycosylhydrolase [Terricaulis sp.]
MTIDRRGVLTAASAAALANVATVARAATAERRHFPRGFIWGASTAAHQIEGNNVSSDVWLLENVTPTLFAEPSGDAANSFELWASDLDLARRLGLNAYRFSLEWARIEPEQGRFSIAMLDHYKAIVEGCRARDLTPVVTFNHYTTPLWFAARGGWIAEDSPALFAAFCDRAARHLSADIGYACTLNEPNLSLMFSALLTPEKAAAVGPVLRAMNEAAGRACGSASFANSIIPYLPDIPKVQQHLLAAHAQAKAAIKAARSNLPVGVALAIRDEEDAPGENVAAARRQSFYGPWLEAARSDDFVGVQNYARVLWRGDRQLPPPEGSRLNAGGEEVYPPSLANAVRYAHAVAGVPILVTEHGVGSDDDGLRAWLIPESLRALHDVIGEGVPLLGYMHWSLLDNFEWMQGFRTHFGLCSVDRATFARQPKPSALVLRDIARRNGV